MKKRVIMVLILLIYISAVTAQCVDNDGGSIYIKGEGDRCWDENSVYESYCYQGDSKVGKFDCPQGCKDGACVGQEPICEDSDNGQYVNVKGIVSYTDSYGNTEIKEDKCTNDKSLDEYYCIKNSVERIGHGCAMGCKDGACLPIPNGCYDSDGGKNYQEQGSTSVPDDEKGEMTYIDVCKGINVAKGDSVLEYYCSGGSLQSETHMCDEGDCSYGACIEKTQSDSKSEDCSEKYGDADGDGCKAFYDSDCGGLEGYKDPADTCDNNIDDDCDGMIDKDDDDKSCVIGCGDGLCTYYEKYQNSDYFCPSDCEMNCEDTDGLDAYQKGIVTIHSGNEYIDQCYKSPNGDNVAEYYCKDDGTYDTKHFPCPLGCDNGKCLGSVEAIDEDEPVAIPEPNIIEQKVFVCKSCELDNICYPIGFRKESKYCISNYFAQQKDDEEQCDNAYECKSNICERNQCGKYCEGCKDSNKNCYPFGTRIEANYCDLDKEFRTQKSNELSCNNNYECVSNLCINSKCIEPSLLQKILDWFRNLFG